MSGAPRSYRMNAARNRERIDASFERRQAIIEGFVEAYRDACGVDPTTDEVDEFLAVFEGELEPEDLEDDLSAPRPDDDDGA